MLKWWRRTRTTLLGIVVGFLLGALGLSGAVRCWQPYTEGPSCNVDPGTSVEEQTVIDLINAHRWPLQPVNADTDLSRSAQWKADDMAQNNYIAHDDPGLRSWYTRVWDCGYDGSTIGEDLAAGQTTAQEVERAWELSPEHNAILLGSSYSAVGVGVTDANDGTRYWAADFGGP